MNEEMSDDQGYEIDETDAAAETADETEVTEITYDEQRYPARPRRLRPRTNLPPTSNGSSGTRC